MKKKLLAILTAALLLFAFTLPAFAYADYDLVYDATGLLDEATLARLGEIVLPQLRDQYDMEVRVDVVNDLEDHTIEDYADLFYDQYGYGSGDNHNGVLLMLYLIEDGGDLRFGDFVFTGAGTGAELLSEHGFALTDTVSGIVNENALSSGLESDVKACTDAIAAYAEEMTVLVTGSGTDALVPDREDLQSLDDPAEEQPRESSEVYVYDLAGLLTEEERDALDRRSREISETYQCAVYTVTLDDFSQYGVTVRAAAENIYTANDFGLGEQKDGVMLLLSMADRDYSLIAHGYGNEAFTDYGKDVLTNEFLDDFRYDDWAGGLQDYVEGSAELLRQAREGHALDGYVDDSLYASGAYGEEFMYKGRSGIGPFGAFFMIVVIPGLIAGIVCLVGKNKMKSVRSATSAADYAVPNSLQLAVNEDIFTHITETRIRIQTETPRGGGGGGGTSISHSGFSGKSGKF